MTTPNMARHLRQGLTAMTALLCAMALALPGCSSEKSTSRQTTHRAVSGGKTATQTSKRQQPSTTKQQGRQASKTGSQAKPQGKVEKGQASYYADKFHGRATASGEKYDKRKLTGAHRTLPFGTVVRVTNTATGQSVDIRINDRGPFKAGRVVDVSRAAAEKLGMIQAGVINCTVQVISEP